MIAKMYDVTFVAKPEGAKKVLTQIQGAKVGWLYYYCQNCVELNIDQRMIENQSFTYKTVCNYSYCVTAVICLCKSLVRPTFHFLAKYAKQHLETIGVFLLSNLKSLYAILL